MFVSDVFGFIRINEVSAPISHHNGQLSGTL